MLEFLKPVLVKLLGYKKYNELLGKAIVENLFGKDD